jgi:hypothetical protein
MLPKNERRVINLGSTSQTKSYQLASYAGEDAMAFFELTRTMIQGPAKQRVVAILTLVTWFSMGAYIMLALDHHLGFIPWSEAATALVGGGVASLVAICIKAV